MDRLEADVFGPEIISGFTAAYPSGTQFAVAFSGGADSLALLHAFAQVRACNSEILLRAIHVDHHLHPESTRWARQCIDVCRRLSVEILVLDVVPRSSGTGHVGEGSARDARYGAFERTLETHDVLCTAHSQDDHIETILLNLMRGAGPRGLSGIPEQRRLGAGFVARPVRGISRSALQGYARATGLPLINDPANEDSRFSRVLLRREVIPVLEARWPAIRTTLARAGERAAESAEMLDALAALDLDTSDGGLGATLDVDVLGTLAPTRQRNAIAAWLTAQGIALPGAARIEQIAREVVGARTDAVPCVRLGDIDVRRYRRRLHLVPRVQPVAGPVVQSWRIPETLTLNHGRLAWEACASGGLDNSVRDTEITVHIRGDDANSTRSSHLGGKSLKKRFQSVGIPPWERGRIPLVYAGNVLAAIGSDWTNPRFSPPPGSQGWRVVWTPRT